MKKSSTLIFLLFFFFLFLFYIFFYFTFFLFFCFFKIRNIVLTSVFQGTSLIVISFFAFDKGINATTLKFKEIKYLVLAAIFLFSFITLIFSLKETFNVMFYLYLSNEELVSLMSTKFNENDFFKKEFQLEKASNMKDEDKISEKEEEEKIEISNEKKFQKISPKLKKISLKKKSEEELEFKVESHRETELFNSTSLTIFTEDRDDPHKNVLSIIKILMTRGTIYNWISIRACYLSLPVFGWIIGPIWCFFTCITTIFILWFTDSTGKYKI